MQFFKSFVMLAAIAVGSFSVMPGVLHAQDADAKAEHADSDKDHDKEHAKVITKRVTTRQVAIILLANMPKEKITALAVMVVDTVVKSCLRCCRSISARQSATWRSS